MRRYRYIYIYKKNQYMKHCCNSVVSYPERHHLFYILTHVANGLYKQ